MSSKWGRTIIKGASCINSPNSAPTPGIFQKLNDGIIVILLQRRQELSIYRKGNVFHFFNVTSIILIDYPQKAKNHHSAIAMANIKEIPLICCRTHLI